ncbi:MAG: hypothetical protein WCW52_02615 [Elusimicrobiales bacterium]|jgi:hypothetical protein
MTTLEMKMHESELLDKLISDYGPTKYQDIVWAMEWARHLRGQEAYRQLPMAEMIEKAMLEVISGQVTSEQILKAIGSGPAPVKTEEKPPAEKKAVKKEAEPEKEKKEKKVKAEKE